MTSKALHFCALAVLAVSATAHAKPVKTLKVCVPMVREEFLTLAVTEAHDKGFFKQQGMQVELVPTRSPRKRTQLTSKAGKINSEAIIDRGVARAVADKKCEFGVSMVEHFLFPEGKRMLTKVSPMYLSMYGEGYDTHLVVAKDSPIKSIQDLKGKRVRVGQLPVHMALHNMLKEAGLTTADVKLETRVEPPQVLAQLNSGLLDAAVTYVPTMPYMLASGQVRALKTDVVRTYVMKAMPHSLIIVNAEFAKGSQADVQKFAKAIAQANDHLARNPTDSIFALERNTKLLGYKPWKIDKVVAQKAGSFVGKMKHLNLTADGPATDREMAKNLVSEYSKMVNDFGYTTEIVDMDAWLSPKAAL